MFGHLHFFSHLTLIWYRALRPMICLNMFLILDTYHQSVNFYIELHVIIPNDSNADLDLLRLRRTQTEMLQSCVEIDTNRIQYKHTTQLCVCVCIMVTMRKQCVLYTICIHFHTGLQNLCRSSHLNHLRSIRCCEYIQTLY